MTTRELPSFNGYMQAMKHVPFHVFKNTHGNLQEDSDMVAEAVLRYVTLAMHYDNMTPWMMLGKVMSKPLKYAFPKDRATDEESPILCDHLQRFFIEEVGIPDSSKYLSTMLNPCYVDGMKGDPHAVISAKKLLRFHMTIRDRLL